MAHLNNFNAHEVDPSVPFEPVPAGKYIAAITDKYIAAITDSEMKATKDGTGSYLELTFTIVEGEYKDRKVWDRLCLNHSNEKTVKISRANLSAICRAVGVMQPRDSFELHNLPLLITIKCKKRENSDEIDNEVKGYEKREAVTGKPQQQEARSDNAPPWKR